MSDGHLYLGDDGVAFAGDSRAAWHDESHGIVLALARAPRRRLVAFPVGSPRQWRPHETRSLPRSKPAPALAFDARLESPVLADETLARDGDDHDDEEGDGDGDVLYDFSRASSSSPSPAVLAVARPEETVLLMRLSLDRQFLAIQTSDIEVQILRLATRESYYIVCKPKPGNRILADGVLWNIHADSPQSSQDLFLVTRLGIEQYRVSPKRRSCALHRTIAVYVHTFWYSPPHSVLIVSTGSRANEIVPFLMQGPSVEKLPRLVFSSAVRKRDLYLASLYGELFAVYGDAKSTRLLLYRVARDKVSCVRSLHLMLPAGSPLEFSVSDNLLVCHSVEFSVSLFFDVKCDANTHDPFSHPLPVSLVPPQRRLHDDALRKSASFRGTRSESPVHAISSPTAMSPIRTSQQHQPPAHMNHQDHASEGDGEYEVSSWKFVAPDLVQRSLTAKDSRLDLQDRVEIRRFHLNLDHVSRSCAHHVEILPFILRRSDQLVAKQLALGLVRERLEEQALAPHAASAILTAVQTMSSLDLDRLGSGRGDDGVSDGSAVDSSSDDELHYNHGARGVASAALRKQFLREGRGESLLASSLRLPARNGNGLALIFQSDFRRYLWGPLIEKPTVQSRDVLSTYLLEYIRILHHCNIPVESLTYVALAKAFLVAGKAGELYQVVQYHLTSDSTELADALLEASEHDASLRQLALDMYTQIGAVATIIQVLLHHGAVDEAIAVAWKHLKIGSCDASLVPGSAFFDGCVRSHNEVGAFTAQQRLHSLLLFLRMWDNACLVGEPSQLANDVSETFPDDMVPSAAKLRWRQCFGFSSQPLSTAEEA